MPMPPKPPVVVKKEPEEQLSTNPVIAIYQRVDQVELEKLGCFGHKSDLDKEQGGLEAMHRYSMLQRFRTGKNFKEVDKFKPKENKEELKQKENEWWRNNAQTQEERELEKKSKVEKARYVAALKALVQDKGKKLNPQTGEIPPLCSCGAQVENINSLKKGEESIQMCANNCQFYKNEKGYVRALRDILHSMSLDK